MDLRRIHKINDSPIIMLYKQISGQLKVSFIIRLHIRLQFQVPTGDVILVKKHQCSLILYVQLHYVVIKHYELLYTVYERKLLEM